MHQALIKKYRGNTLVEVMVALALTSFAATLAVVIFLNIQKSTLPFFKIKGTELAIKYMEESILKHDYFDKTSEENGFTIKKKVTRHTVYQDCSTITISVWTVDQKKIAELQTTLYAD